MSQVFLFYSLLTLILGITAAAQGQTRCQARAQGMPQLRFFWLTALFDVEANFCMLLAIRYTSLTSAFLLGSGGVLPFVLVIGTVVLGQRYRPVHLVATLLALAGYAVVVYADVGSDDDEAPSPVLGDLLCALAAALFACSSIGQEALLAEGCSPAALLRRMQPAAASLSGAQVLLLGSAELPHFWALLLAPFGAGAPLLAASASLVLMYALAPLVISRGGAAFFNVSLLTANLYGSLWALVRFGEVVSPLKAAGFAAVFAGLLTFHAAGPPAMNTETPAMALLQDAPAVLEPPCGAPAGRRAAPA